jgi:hypothetical protein
MQTYENKIQQMFSKTVDNELVCVVVLVLQILITKDKIFLFSNYNMWIYNILQKFTAHLKPCGGTSFAEH